MTDEIALFIDFENIRYSLINVQHREPDPQELIAVARRFGTVMVARAYADWQRQPDFFKGSLTAAMIDRVDCPAKVRERFRQNNAQPMYHQHSGFDRMTAREEHAGEEAEFEAEAQQSIEDGEVHDELDVRAAELNDQNDEEFEAEGEEEFETEEPRRYEPSLPYTPGGSYYQQSQPQIITQSTVDLNMLMDIIETVFDRPSINTFVLMSGDRDFTRICARLKLRLNKRVIVVGIPGTVSRDLISAADQFLPLGAPGSGPLGTGYPQHRGYAPQGAPFMPSGPVEPDEPGFIQFLDYIDRHWSWRTIGGVANFIGDPFNPKNRFRGRLTRESARDLLRVCVDDGILHMTVDPMGGENLRLNREHPCVTEVLGETALR